MSKICIVGDMHWRLELPYSSAISDGRKSEWEDVLSEIVKVAGTCDAVVLMGDVFNSKHNHSSVIRGLVDFLKRLGDKEIHIISGNHCRYGEKTALDFLQTMKHKSWRVYSEPVAVEVAGSLAMMVPFMTPALLGVETKEEGEKEIFNRMSKAGVAFVHHALSGAKTTEFFDGEIVLDRNKTETLFGMTFYGHIHRAEKLSDKTWGTGSIFTQEVGESGKSVWVWDSQTKKTEEVPLPVRGIYKVVWEEKGISDVIPANSIVKCYVTSRETNIEDVKENLKLFDASIIVEQYPNERAKVHFEDGGLDLSVESMLKRYSEAKGLSYSDLKEGFELIK